MTSAQIKESAKSTVLAKFTALYDSLSAEMVGNIAYIPVTVGGQEVWVEVKLTTKQWTDTKVSDAFDPFTAREEYEEEQRIKAEEKAIKEKEKAAKVARSAAKRAKTSKVKATAEQSDED
jgi:hypothetical protein